MNPIRTPKVERKQEKPKEKPKDEQKVEEGQKMVEKPKTVTPKPKAKLQVIPKVTLRTQLKVNPPKQVQRLSLKNSNGNPGLNHATSKIASRGEVNRFYGKAKGGFNDSLRIRGHELLGRVNTDTSAYTILANYFINPLIFQGTRLSVYAAVYEKYCFRRLVVHFESANAATASGQYILAYDRDIADETPPSTEAGMRQLMAFQSSEIQKIWEDARISCNLSDLQDFYYTSPSLAGDERLAYQGQIYLAVMSLLSASLAGNMWIEYEIDLYDPQMEFAEHASYATKATSTTIATGLHAALNDFFDAPTVSSIDPNLPFLQDGNGNWRVILEAGAKYILAISGATVANSSSTVENIVPDIHIDNSYHLFVGSGTSTPLQVINSAGAGNSTTVALYSILIPALAVGAFLYFDVLSSVGTTTIGSLAVRIQKVV